MKKIGFIIFLLFFILNCSTSNQKNRLRDIAPLIKNYISLEIMEKAGFEHMKPSDYSMLILRDSLYIMNTSDSMLVKFNGTTPTRSYKLNAQGPGGMLSARSIFLYDNKTIAVFDIQKQCVLFFDLNLNYKNEQRVDPAISYITSRENNFIASGDFPDNKLIALLDHNFEKTETFLKSDLPIPFQTKFPPQVYNRLYLLDDHQIAYTYWFYLYKQCIAYIYDTDSKLKIHTLKWDQDHIPTKKDINENLNKYSNSMIEKKSIYYIVGAKFQKKLFDPGYCEIIIFKEDGRLISRNHLSSELIRSKSDFSDTRVFFLDDERGITVLDLKEL